MENSEALYLHMLLLAREWQPKHLAQVINALGSAEAVAKAKLSELISTGLFSQKKLDWVKNIDLYNLTDLGNILEKQEVKLVHQTHPDYPKRLLQLTDPPLLLYVRGNTKILNSANISVVGSRRMSGYGQQATKSLLKPVLSAGITLVSGLAYGIDQLALELACEANQPAIAVLGGGVLDERIYPKTNVALAKQIITFSGAIISEYPPDQPPAVYKFVARNRIIAGISPTTLIIEAARNSGALISANFALENGREVLAVPGPINHVNAEGVNELIRQGAQPICKPEDLAELLNISLKPKTATFLNSPETKTLLQLLHQENRSLEEILAVTRFSTEQALAGLGLLEIAELIIQHPNGDYGVIRSQNQTNK